MKRIFKSMQGVTLLEIMLVLAIAAMIIVMSVRYYQSASASQQSNTVAAQIGSIIAAADGLSQASGSYSSANVSTSTIEPLLPLKGLKTPFNTDITIAATGATTYTITVDAVPANVCPLLAAKFTNNKNVKSSPTCSSTGNTTLVFTYTSNP